MSYGTVPTYLYWGEGSVNVGGVDNYLNRMLVSLGSLSKLTLVVILTLQKYLTLISCFCTCSVIVYNQDLTNISCWYQTVYCTQKWLKSWKNKHIHAWSRVSKLFLWSALMSECSCMCYFYIYIYVHLFIVFCVEMLIISCVIFPLKHTP